jgi:hypothetical protein
VGSTSERGEDVGKGYRRVDIVQILCTHVCKYKNEPCCNYSGIEGEGIKENASKGKFNYDMFDIL